EALAMNKPAPSEPPDTPEPEPSETAREPVPPPSPASSPPSAQEIARPSELQDEPTPEKVKVAAVKPKEIKKKQSPPPPPPKPKPSKEKVKKSGLLGLLGNSGKKTSPSPSTKRLSRRKRAPLQVAKNARLPESPGTSQKLAQLRQKLLSSEKRRLMKRKSVSKRRASKIKIIHGSGRNYGIISSAIEQKRGRLTSVYNNQLLKNPDLQGNLIVEFTISPEGRVIKSQVLTSSFSDPLFEKALIEAIQGWKFPSVKQGETTVLYPISFFPAS
ncbi:MAG: TonB family protein, partial [Nitrospiria bacterium]